MVALLTVSIARRRLIVFFFSSFPILFRSAVPVAIATVSGNFRYNESHEATQNFNSRSFWREKDATRECAKRATRKTHSFAFVRETVELMVVARTTKTMKRRMPLFPYFAEKKKVRLN